MGYAPITNLRSNQQLEYWKRIIDVHLNLNWKFDFVLRKVKVLQSAKFFVDDRGKSPALSSHSILHINMLKSCVSPALDRWGVNIKHHHWRELRRRGYILELCWTLLTEGLGITAVQKDSIIQRCSFFLSNLRPSISKSHDAKAVKVFLQFLICSICNSKLCE